MYSCQARLGLRLRARRLPIRGKELSADLAPTRQSFTAAAQAVSGSACIGGWRSLSCRWSCQAYAKQGSFGDVERLFKAMEAFSSMTSPCYSFSVEHKGWQVVKSLAQDDSMGNLEVQHGTCRLASDARPAAFQWTLSASPSSYLPMRERVRASVNALRTAELSTRHSALSLFC